MGGTATCRVTATGMVCHVPVSHPAAVAPAEAPDAAGDVAAAEADGDGLLGDVPPAPLLDPQAAAAPQAITTRAVTAFDLDGT
jgi:hypothetical protein